MSGKCPPFLDSIDVWSFAIRRIICYDVIMRENQEIIIIAAMSENRVIGKNNALPWSLAEDMIHFRELTFGWPCVMGRKTWESLSGRPLAGRLNIVVSSRLKEIDSPADNKSTVIKNVSSLTAAIEYCAAYQKIFICGGETIYRAALPFASRIELTVIHQNYDGDTFFPEIDSSQWIKTSARDFDTYSFIVYSKVNGISVK